MADQGQKKCPFCGEHIKAEATKCRFCGEFLDGRASPAVLNPTAKLAPQPTEQAPARGNGEADRLLYSGPLSRIGLVRPAVILAFWLVVAVVVGIVGTRAAPESKHIPVLAAVAVAVIAALWFLAKWVIFHSRVFHITENQIEYEEGVFAKRVETLEMWRIEDVSYRQGFIHGLLGLGSVHVKSSDATTPRLVIGPLSNARSLFEAIRKAEKEADRRKGVVHLER